jgi:hypothetical protein
VIGYLAMNLLNAAGGTVQADVSGQTLALNGAGAITNQGRFRAMNGGVLSQPTAGAFTNFSAGVLTGGSYEVGAGSAFRFNAANIGTNAAAIILDGVGSAITRVQPALAISPRSTFIICLSTASVPSPMMRTRWTSPSPLAVPMG